MARLVPSLLVVLGAWAGPPSGAAAGEASPSSEILGKALAPTPIVHDLEHLADTIGGRPTGSKALERAVEWGLERLRSAGLENVHAESYTLPHAWLPKVETGEVVVARDGEPDEHTALRVASMPFSASTSPSGIDAEVVDVGPGDAAAFAVVGDRLRGRWALIRTEPMKSIVDLFNEYMVTPGFIAAARQGGAAGVLYVSNRPGRLLYRHNATLDGSISEVHAVVVEREGALRIARLVEAGRKVHVKVTSVSEAIPDAKAQNVVGEIRGREKPDEVVILGAHLDSWDLGRGALDNGCNVALVIDAARSIRSALGDRRPRSTLRFVLYTGEEAGLFGSLAEVRAQRGGLDRVRAQIVFDEGTGRTSGFSLGGRADLRPAVEAALADAASFGPFTHTTDAFVGTDNYDYMIEGVPTLVANQADVPYLPDYHAESDTFDKADLRELKVNTALAGVLAFSLADRVDPPAPRQTRAQVEETVKATGLDQQMKTFGLWNDFASGKRGRVK